MLQAKFPDATVINMPVLADIIHPMNLNNS